MGSCRQACNKMGYGIQWQGLENWSDAALLEIRACHLQCQHAPASKTRRLQNNGMVSTVNRASQVRMLKELLCTNVYTN